MHKRGSPVAMGAAASLLAALVIASGWANPAALAQWLPGAQGMGTATALALLLVVVAGAWLLYRKVRPLAHELVTVHSRLRTLLDNVPSAVITTDEAGRIETANPAATRMFGYAPGEMEGRSLETMLAKPECGKSSSVLLPLGEAGSAQQATAAGGRVTEGVLGRWRSILKKAFASGQPDQFEFLLPIVGGFRIYQARITPEFARDGTVATVLTIAHDITDLKQAEAVLRESEQRIKGITANVPGMVYQCRRRAGEKALAFNYVNDSAPALCGLPPQDILADPEAFFRLIHSQDQGSFHETLERSADKLTVWNWEGRIIIAGGDEKWINLRATPRQTGTGDIIWDGIIFNITENKRAEQQIRQSREQLRELSAYHETAIENERKKIAREIHDELGQTLTALRMDVSVLGMNFGQDNPQLLEKIRPLKDLVDQTIRLARNVTAHLRPTALDLGITSAIEWLAEDFRKRTGIECKAKGIDKEIALDDNRATAVFRILQESLTNVIRHAAATRVEITLKQRKGMLSLKVRDNGRGFDPDGIRQKKSFGLVGIRERALALGGEVVIASAPDQGTTLSVSIPTETH